MGMITLRSEGGCRPHRAPRNTPQRRRCYCCRPGGKDLGGTQRHRDLERIPMVFELPYVSAMARAAMN